MLAEIPVTHSPAKKIWISFRCNYIHQWLGEFFYEFLFLACLYRKFAISVSFSVLDWISLRLGMRSARWYKSKWVIVIAFFPLFTLYILWQEFHIAERKINVCQWFLSPGFFPQLYMDVRMCTKWANTEMSGFIFRCECVSMSVNTVDPCHTVKPRVLKLRCKLFLMRYSQLYMYKLIY